jgi:hypothetical protein
VFFICILFDSHSPVEIEQKDDECSNASESSNSTELDTVAPTSLEKARPPVGRRKRTAVSTCSSFNDNSSDDGSRLGNEIQINFKRHPLATNWISLLFYFFKKVPMFLAKKILIPRVANFLRKNYALNQCQRNRRNR